MSTPETSTLTTGANGQPTLKRKLFVGMQHVLPQHLLTSIVYSATRSRSPAIKNWLIGSFMRGFKPEMGDAVQPNPLAYGSFNEFFTRALRPDARPIVRDPGTLISPVDGTVSQLGRIGQADLSGEGAALLAGCPARRAGRLDPAICWRRVLDALSRAVQLPSHSHAAPGDTGGGVVCAGEVVQRECDDGGGGRQPVRAQ
jgi:hypothetical protein